jgi:sialate O-acetylesterase
VEFFSARRLAASAAVLGLLLLLAPPPVIAEITLPAILGDHMVLMRGKATVWGWAAPGSTITVSLAGRGSTALAGADGRWSV